MAILTAGRELAQLVSELGEAGEEPWQRPGVRPGQEQGRRRKLTPSWWSWPRLSPALSVAAGNETCPQRHRPRPRPALEHLEQKERWRSTSTAAPTAVQEIIRWASPVIHFPAHRHPGRRHPGLRQEFVQGDKVVLWYWSSNRDEAVFTDPHIFDIGCTPNEPSARRSGACPSIGAHWPSARLDRDVLRAAAACTHIHGIPSRPAAAGFTNGQAPALRLDSEVTGLRGSAPGSAPRP